MVNPSEEQPAGTAQAQPPAIQGIQPPTGLNLSGKDKAVNWKIYKQQWENYSIVAQLDRQSKDYRVALFLYSTGQEAVKTHNSFDVSKENRRKLAEKIKEFDNYAVGETNETYERYIFNSREQKEGEPIDRYVAELRNSGTIEQFLHMPSRLADKRPHCPWNPRWGNTQAAIAPK